MRRAPALAAVIALAMSVLHAGAAEPPRSRPIEHRPGPAPEAPGRDRYVIGAAGDIACERGPLGREAPALCQYDDTSDLVVRSGLAEVLLLGDIQYERGRYAAFTNYFDPTWGRAYQNLSPAPGNHEHDGNATSTPRGYFRYFGDRVKGPDALGYYSFDLGACPDAPCWHLISLNSMLCFAPGGCRAAADPSDPGRGNLMHAWLEQDLAAHPDETYPCTLAFWHHPRFSFTTGSGATRAVGPLWTLLYRAHADVVLVGHSHNYQRWDPQDPRGNLDTDRGIRQFVVGTGGRSHYALPDDPFSDNLAAAQDDAFGILRLVLKADGYRWRWVSADGQPSFADRADGDVLCVRARASVTGERPTPPASSRRAAPTR